MRAPRGAPGADGRYCLDQRLQRVAVVDVGSRARDGQRDALGLRQHVQLAARLAAIDGVGAGQRPPFFARTDAASMITDVQSSSPRAPSSSSTARCRRRHRPALVHCPNRRCAVWNGTPNDGGRSRHAHPLARTCTIAVNTARSSSGAVPPPCGRGRNSGINGSASAHSSPGTSRNDN